MPNWFRGVVAASLLASTVVAVAKPALAPIAIALVVIVNLTAGAGAVLVSRYDRSASGADDPTTLNLNRLRGDN